MTQITNIYMKFEFWGFDEKLKFKIVKRRII